MKALILFVLIFSSQSFASSLDFFESKELLLEKLVEQETRAYVKKIQIDWMDKDLKEGLYQEAKVCEGSLIPKSASQKGKKYHVSARVFFDRNLPGPHPLCAVSQRSTSKCRGLKNEELKICHWKNLKCLQTKVKVFKILSDIYLDSCDQVVRGFAMVSFSSPGEGINDSVSPGHSLEVDQQFSGGVHSYRDGPTSLVEKKRFILLTPQ